MQEIYKKYKELSQAYNNLCFKINEGNFFIIGIILNDYAICYKFDIKFYNDFDVMELDNLNDFNILQTATVKSLNSISDENNNNLILK